METILVIKDTFDANITNGADLEKELKKTEDTVNFNMGQ